MTKLILWKLTAGNMTGQETEDQKRKAGLEYIEKLKQTEKVVEVKEEEGFFKIICEDV